MAGRRSPLWWPSTSRVRAAFCFITRGNPAELYTGCVAEVQAGTCRQAKLELHGANAASPGQATPAQPCPHSPIWMHACPSSPVQLLTSTATTTLCPSRQASRDLCCKLHCSRTDFESKGANQPGVRAGAAPTAGSQAELSAAHARPVLSWQRIPWDA